MGSTGKPKGVCVPHRAIIRLVVDTDYVEILPDDGVAQASNASFDAATFEIWGALVNGAVLVGVPKSVLLAPPALAEQIRLDRITILFVTTALFNQLSLGAPGIFAPLRTLCFGGEAVDPAARRLDEGPLRRCSTFMTDGEHDLLDMARGRGRSATRAPFHRPAHRQHDRLRAGRPHEACSIGASELPAATAWRRAISTIRS
jgi:non-ribosomal peptide synthetase component F